jgi:urea transport system substrate-binding protein
MASSSSQEYGTVSPATEPPEVRAGTARPADTRASSEEPSAPLPLPGESGMLAHYRSIRLLGQGGMGRVYQAEDTRLRRPVALKVMHPELIPNLQARERFLREARAMAAVQSDHVVTVYEVDQADEVPYLAMEFLHGQTLEEWLAAGPVPQPGEILRIGREIATGLAAAQECGLVHRDIKPANLWLEAPAGRVKILDFGLARPMDNQAGLTRTGTVVGTPYYMAPEQSLGQPVDGRSDLFSLGVVLYRLCTGQLPFQGNCVTAVLMAVASEKPRPIRELNPSIPPALADLVMRLLEKDPARRPESAGKVAEALRAMKASTSHGEVESPSAAPGPGPPEPVRSRRWSAGLPGRRWRVVGAGGVALLLGAALIAWWGGKRPPAQADCNAPAVAPRLAGPPVRVGVLYSATGTMALSERPILDGVLLAVDEINERGGVLGRPVEAVVEDGESDETVFARKAAKLIGQDHAAVLVGCWTSVSRKAVRAVVERHDHLLLYPVSYEGMEQSKHVVYGGSVPNQQILPALQWCYGFLNKKRWFLVGFDSVFSHAAHAVIRDEARRLESQVVGEELLLPGHPEMAGLARRIAAAKPDLIINTVSGDANVAFFRALRRGGIRASQVPTLSFRLSEEELSGLAPAEAAGHYAAGNYFQSLDLPENQAFLRRVRARFGPGRTVTDPMQTAYTLVHLWAQAVRAAGKEDVCAVRAAIRGQRFGAPQGPVTIDPATLHTIQVSRVGRIDDRGRFQEVFLSPRPIQPEPFPASRSRQAWQEFLEQLRQRWGGRWENPGP